MKAFTKRDLYKLKAAINGFTGEAIRIRENEIKPKHLEEKAKGWERKRSLGLHSRFHQLAYAFMLGKKYSDLEKGRPLVKNWWQTDSAAETILAICRLYGGYRLYWCKELTKDTIINWFKTDENIFTWEPKPKRPEQTSFLVEISRSLRKSVAARVDSKKKRTAQNG